VLLLALAIVIAAATSSCRRPQRDIPPELLGVWNTANDTRYADRYFEFRGDGLVVFGTGEGNSESYVVVDVRQANVADGIQYAVDYVNLAGDPYTFSFVFYPAGQNIVFVNQQRTVWRRAS
jgi:hypothetical protein